MTPCPRCSGKGWVWWRSASTGELERDTCWACYVDNLGISGGSAVEQAGEKTGGNATASRTQEVNSGVRGRSLACRQDRVAP